MTLLDALNNGILLLLLKVSKMRYIIESIYNEDNDLLSAETYEFKTNKEYDLHILEHKNYVDKITYCPLSKKEYNAINSNEEE